MYLYSALSDFRKFLLAGTLKNKFFMENDLYNKVKPDQKFYLRNKSDKSRPDRESVGVQP